MKHSATTTCLLLFVALFGGCKDDDAHTHCHTEDCTPNPDAPDAPEDDAPDAPLGDVQEVNCAGATLAETIEAPGFAFEPDDVTISVGETIRFIMPGSHSAHAGAPGATTGDFDVGFSETKCFTFAAAGSYPFFCIPHEFTGSITVE